MPVIILKDTEPFDVAIRRFKRACEKAGIPTKLRQIEYYEKPTSKRKRKKAAAIKRYQKKLQKEQETLVRDHQTRKRNKPAVAKREKRTSRRDDY